MALSQFELLKSSFYSRVQATPFEPRPREMIFSDIVLHLPVLEYYASKSDSAAEFGVRDGNSTVALISGCKFVYSFDIERSPIVNTLKSIELPEGHVWEFHLADTGSSNIPLGGVDMLFIDTLHTYEHVKKELKYHARKVSKYLAFHDTFTCGDNDRSGPDPKALGIWPAIAEFMCENPQWKIVYKTNANNGLLVLERS